LAGSPARPPGRRDRLRGQHPPLDGPPPALRGLGQRPGPEPDPVHPRRIQELRVSRSIALLGGTLRAIFAPWHKAGRPWYPAWITSSGSRFSTSSARPVRRRPGSPPRGRIVVRGRRLGAVPT